MGAAFLPSSHVIIYSATALAALLATVALSGGSNHLAGYLLPYPQDLSAIFCSNGWLSAILDALHEFPNAPGNSAMLSLDEADTTRNGIR